MSDRSPNAAQDLIEGFFLREECEPSNEEVIEAVATIASDEGLRRSFDRLALADRATSGQDGPAGFERAFGRAIFDARLDAMLADEAEESDEPGDTADNVVPLRIPPRTSATPVAAWVSAAAVLLISTFAIVDGSRPDLLTGEAAQFQARTAVATDFRRSDASPKLVAYCVERIDGDVRFTGPDEAPFGVVSCPADAELKLAIEQKSEWRRYAAFFGVHENGTLTWYGPSPADQRPVSVASDEPVVPVGETIRLGVNHEPGAVRIHAIFADEPVDFPALERWVERHRPTLFDHAMVVEPAAGETDTQLFEIVEER